MLKIGDFAKLAQVSTKTVRYYDRRGLLKPAWIDRFTGYRYYTVEQLTQLNRILALKEFGFTLDQIRHMLAEPLSLAELRGMFRLKYAELEQHIQEEQERLVRIETRLEQIEQGDDLFLSMMSQQKEQLEMEPEIISKPAFTVVGMRYFGENQHQEIPQLWGQFLPRAHEIKDKSAVAYGVCGDVDDNGRFHYMAGYGSDHPDIPEGMARWDIPEQTYAVFPCTLDTISETYQFIFEKWLPQVNYQPAGTPDFEFYPEAFDPETSKDMAVYMPIK